MSDRILKMSDARAAATPVRAHVYHTVMQSSVIPNIEAIEDNLLDMWSTYTVKERDTARTLLCADLNQLAESVEKIKAIINQ